MNREILFRGKRVDIIDNGYCMICNIHDNPELMKGENND